MTQDDAKAALVRLGACMVRSEVGSVSGDRVLPGEPEKLLTITLYYANPGGSVGFEIGEKAANALFTLCGIFGRWPLHRKQAEPLSE